MHTEDSVIFKYVYTYVYIASWNCLKFLSYSKYASDARQTMNHCKNDDKKEGVSTTPWKSSQISQLSQLFSSLIMFKRTTAAPVVYTLNERYTPEVKLKSAILLVSSLFFLEFSSADRVPVAACNCIDYWPTKTTHVWKNHAFYLVAETFHLSAFPVSLSNALVPTLLFPW